MNSSVNESVLYCASTPLNILTACVHALNLPSSINKQLWLIDQQETVNNLYEQALLKWQGSPFSEIQIFSGRQKGTSKLAERKNVFLKIDKLLVDFLPRTVVTSSDRRVEFQYILHVLASKQHKPSGVYLDDGLYSYQGRVSVWYQDLLNSLLKKMFYGSWWEEPKLVGGSSKIEKLYLFRPDLALAEIKNNKVVEPLPTALFTSHEIVELSGLVFDVFNESVESYQDIEVLIFVPHPNNLKKMDGYLEKLKALIECLLINKKVAVKYHPRVGLNDPLDFKKMNVTKIVNPMIASEFLLPALHKNCLVIGDVGTALLTCKWLREDLNLIAVLSKQDAFQSKFIGLMEEMDIKVVDNMNQVAP